MPKEKVVDLTDVRNKKAVDKKSQDFLQGFFDTRSREEFDFDKQRAKELSQKFPPPKPRQ